MCGLVKPVTGENGYIESLNGQLRDELLDREVFHTLLELKMMIQDCPQQLLGLGLSSTFNRTGPRDLRGE